MINPTGKKLEKLLFGMFDDAIQGVDRYNHNGCLWLIFTDEMRWVVEYTKTQTLWYNYYFFKNEMEMVGLDCVEDKDLIQKWFESRFLGMPKVEEAFDPFFDQDQYVEDTIQNGVKHTLQQQRQQPILVQYTIQNGVKHTEEGLRPDDSDVEDTIQNGVKETIGTLRRTAKWGVDDIIQNGVKETHDDCSNNIARVEGIVRIGEKLN
jgi:hypothetical protein